MIVPNISRDFQRIVNIVRLTIKLVMVNRLYYIIFVAIQRSRVNRNRNRNRGKALNTYYLECLRNDVRNS